MVEAYKYAPAVDLWTEQSFFIHIFRATRDTLHLEVPRGVHLGLVLINN